jgi:hypothetical protein
MKKEKLPRELPQVNQKMMVSLLKHQMLNKLLSFKDKLKNKEP